MKKGLKRFLIFIAVVAVIVVGFQIAPKVEDAINFSKATELQLDETAKTDIAELKLDNAYLSVTNKHEYYRDNNGIIKQSQAPYGKCYVILEYTVTNTDRGGTVDYKRHADIKYNGKTYSAFNAWPNNYIIQAGDHQIDAISGLVDMESGSVDDGFTVFVYLPNSDGKEECFKYEIPAKQN